MKIKKQVRKLQARLDDLEILADSFALILYKIEAKLDRDEVLEEGNDGEQEQPAPEETVPAAEHATEG